MVAIEIIVSLLGCVVLGVIVYMILSSRKKLDLVPDSQKIEDGDSGKGSVTDDKNIDTEIEKLKREIYNGCSSRTMSDIGCNQL